MVHFRYVRTLVVDTFLVSTPGTHLSRVMPARLLFIGVLLIWSCIAQSQTYLRPACDSTCLPAFTSIQDNVDLDCTSDFPPFEVGEATGCASSPVSQMPTVELDYTSSTLYTVETAEGIGADWALWLGGFEDMGLGASEYFHPTDAGVSMEVFANGTARFSGVVANDEDPTQQFLLDVFLQYGQDYDSWTSQGRLAKDELGTGAFPDWTYYEVVDTLSRLEGLGAYEGDMLYLDHMPFSRLFGFQLGDNGANNRNTNFGVSGWFWYRGTMSGADIVGTGDINADLTNAQDQSASCPVVEGRERIAMAWSDCGHDIQIHTVERHDLEAPTFVELPPLEAADCTSLPDTADLSAFVVSDDCDSPLSLEVLSDVVEGEPCNQVLTRTWRLTDACGNATDTFQVVTLIDTTGPVFSVMDETLACEDFDDYVPTTPSFTDNCTPSEDIVWTAEEGEPVGAFPSEFSLTVTYIATDLCGNSTVQTATLTVVDDTAPEWVELPADTTLDCAAWPTYDIPVPVAIDNCTDDLGNPTVDTVITEGACEGQFSMAITTTVVDLAGNAASHTQTIEVTDTTAPEFIYFPGPVTIDCGTDWPAVEGNNLPVGSDDCSNSELTWTESESEGECPGSTVLTRTFTLTDGCGNATTATQELQREDNSGPTWTFVPADMEIPCGIGLPTDLATAQDDCAGVDSVWVTLTEVDPTEGGTVDACPVIERFERTFQAVDFCGNISSTTQTIDVIDTVAPVLSNVPADLTLSCGEALPLDVPTIEDACSMVVLASAVDTTQVDCPGTLTVVRTFTATDACGNSATAQQTIQVIDEVAPEFTMVPANLTILCDETLPSDMAEATDACSLPVTVELLSVDSVAGDCPQAWSVTRTFLATDACGNTAEAEQIVTVVDTVAPELELGLDSLQLECGDALPTNLPVFGDNCDSMVMVAELDSVVTQGACTGAYTVVRQFMATDACGNSTPYEQVVDFEDTTAPVVDAASIPADTVLQCGDALPEEVPTATEGCSEVSLMVSTDSLSTDSLCTAAQLVTRTFTFSDDCGNLTSVSQAITIVDTIAPTFDESTLPEDATYDCLDVHPVCADFDVLVFDDCGSTSLDCVVDTVPTACPGTYTLIMTFTGSDGCGNTVSANSTFNVEDTTGPVIEAASLPADTTIQCGNNPDLLLSEDFDVSDDCNGWEMTAERVTEGLEESPCEYTLIDTYTFTDCDGNETVFVHTITVVDTEGPTISFAIFQDEPYYCAFEVPEYAVPASLTADNDLPFGASDNCATDDEIVVTYSDSVLATNGDNDFTVLRTWVLTDHCDNKTELEQVIVVEEPALVLPNAFSPGGNGYNDRYVIGNLGLENNGAPYPPCDWNTDEDFVSFMVFNRWGTKVFESEPGGLYLNDWDGRDSGGELLVDGTYFILFRVNATREEGTYVDIRKDQ